MILGQTELTNLGYSRVKGIGWVGCCNGKEVVHEAVVNYHEWATMKPLWWDWLARRVKWVQYFSFSKIKSAAIAPVWRAVGTPPRKSSDAA